MTLDDEDEEESLAANLEVEKDEKMLSDHGNLIDTKSFRRRPVLK